MEPDVRRAGFAVERELEELESLGVIEFETEGASEKPILRGGTEMIDFSFSIGRVPVGHQPGASA